MVADAFALAGWDVHFLGANVPSDALIDHAQRWRPHLLGLSASLPQHVRELRQVTGGLRQLMGDSCPHLLIGGLGLNASLLAGEQFDAAAWISDPAAAVIAGEQLCVRETVEVKPQSAKTRGSIERA